MRELAQALLDYAKRCKEEHADQPSVRADLVWCAGDGEKYVSPKREVGKAKRKRLANDDDK